MDESGSKDLRARYARSIAAAAGADDPRIEQAFAAIPRESFVPDPPWTVIRGGTVVQTDNLAKLYDDVLVAIDRRRGINNGEPSLHAAWLDAVRPVPGEHALHVGAGTGYYTAILDFLTGPDGQVDAYEVEADLAGNAARNLADRSSIRVHAESAFGAPLPAADVVYVNAGVNAPDAEWLTALRPGGRLIFPWQPMRAWGMTILVTRRPGGFSAKMLMRVGFIPLSGETTKPMLARHMPEFDISQTRSIWLTRERKPDRSATALYESVWFSADAVCANTH